MSKAQNLGAEVLPIGEVVVGDCLEVMKSWPDACIDCCVTSPPYCATIRAWRDLLKGNTGGRTSRSGIRNGLKSSTLRSNGQRLTLRRSLGFGTPRFITGCTNTGYQPELSGKFEQQSIGAYPARTTRCTAETGKPIQTGTVGIRPNAKAHMPALHGRNSLKRFWRGTDSSARNAEHPTTHSTNYRCITLSRGANIHRLGLRRPI